MRNTIGLVVATLAASLATACADAPSSDSEFAPLTASVPIGVTDILTNDSLATEVPLPGTPWALAVEVNGCRVALRDPVTRTSYRLAQVGETDVREVFADGSVTPHRTEANYRVSDSSTSLPAGTYLRVACRTNQVVGLAGVPTAGT